MASCQSYPDRYDGLSYIVHISSISFSTLTPSVHLLVVPTLVLAFTALTNLTLERNMRFLLANLCLLFSALVALGDKQFFPDSETYVVPRLDMRMMLADSGLPGGSWPPGSQVNTTIKVEFNMPIYGIDTIESTTVGCAAQWPNGTFPRGQGFKCERSAVAGEVEFCLDSWGKAKDGSGGRGELWLTVNVVRVETDDAGER